MVLSQETDSGPVSGNLKAQLTLGAIKHGFKLVDKMGSRVETEMQRQQITLYSSLSPKIEGDRYLSWVIDIILLRLMKLPESCTKDKCNCFATEVFPSIEDE